MQMQSIQQIMEGHLQHVQIHSKKNADSEILLTTGADSSFSVQNIYDIAGNVYEWTLEKTDRDSLPCAQRGGDVYDTGSGSPAAKRNNYYTSSAYYYIGFRVTLW